MQEYTKCSMPWTSAVVLANGEVKPCCWCKGNVGNLNDSTFEEIWEGTKIVSLRASILQDKVHPMCVNAPCSYDTSKPEIKIQQAKKINGCVIFTKSQRDIFSACKKIGIEHAIKSIDKDGDFMIVEIPDIPPFDLRVEQPYAYIERIGRFKK